MLSGERPAIAGNQHGRLLGERTVISDSFLADQIEGDAAVNAALPEVSVERAVESMLVQQLAEIAEVIADAGWWDCGVLPTRPGWRLARNKGCHADACFAQDPNCLLVVLVVVEANT